MEEYTICEYAKSIINAQPKVLGFLRLACAGLCHRYGEDSIFLYYTSEDLTFLALYYVLYKQKEVGEGGGLSAPQHMGSAAFAATQFMSTFLK